MRKILAITVAFLILLALAACGAVPEETTRTTDSPDTSAEVTSSPETTADTERVRTSVGNDERAEMFRDFLIDNYTELSDALYGGIAGVGFADLDCDGGMEMILFDAGASASMGVQFFDIIDGKVECVSANIDSIGDSFGGDHYTETYVNANYFDDFRLMKDKDSGEEYFLVQSGNGAIDFSYTEDIRFGADGEALTLTSLDYIYEEYDEDTGDVTSTEYKVMGEDASEKEYNAAVEERSSSAEDTELELKGVFAWEQSDYADGLSGLLAMTDEALSLADEQIDLY